MAGSGAGGAAAARMAGGAAAAPASHPGIAPTLIPGAATQPSAHAQYLQQLQAREQARREAKKAAKADKAAKARAQAAAGLAAQPGTAGPGTAAAEPEEADDAGDRDAGNDEADDGHMYEQYCAQQIRDRFPDVMGHPDPLVETASLASIPLPPPSYEPTSLLECIHKKLLSDAQLESVIYANMKFTGPRLPSGHRAGFFLGDGAGVGKGRQIAALIKQHWHDGGRRIMWVSVSNDLRKDAERDLKDILADNIKTYPRGTENLPPAKKNLPFDGVLFVTYSMLVSGLRATKKVAKEETELTRIDVPTDSRLGQFLRWLEGCRGGSPLVIFDECHKAKNLMPAGGGKPSQTAKAVVELQERLPEAKVLYSSATGASEPRNLAYMTRLGMWGFKDAKEMIDMLSKSRMGALELAAMSMKATGTYLSRTLSYEGAEFGLAHIDVDPVFKVMYERASKFWQLLWQVVDTLQLGGRANSQFWGSHQRFFKLMLMAAKVPACARLALKSIEEGMAVVVGLQSTGEANTNALLEDAGDLHDLGKDSVAELMDVECQVWEAVETWRNLQKAEVVAQDVGAQAAERAQGAALVGIDVNGRERLPEEIRVAKRLAMKAAQKEEEEREKQRERKEKQKAWHQGKEKHRQELLAEKEEAEEDVKDYEEKLANLERKIQQEQQQMPESGRRRLHTSTAAAARQGVGSEEPQEELMDHEEQEPSQQQRAAGKRNAVVLSDSDESPAPKKPRGRTATQVIAFDDDSDDDFQEPPPPSTKPAPRQPVHIDLIDLLSDSDEEDCKAAVEDIKCQVCGSPDDEDDDILVCDGCDTRGGHLLCLGLTKVPNCAWFCDHCKKNEAAKASVSPKTVKRQREEDGDEVLSPLKVNPQQAGQRTRLQRNLANAKAQLREKEQELKGLEEEIEQGPPPTPRETRRRPMATRSGAGYLGNDPTVRNLEIKDTRIDGYKYYVERGQLQDLERDQDLDLYGLPLGAPTRPGACKGAAAGGKGAGKGKAAAAAAAEDSDDDDDFVMEVDGVPDFEDEGLLSDPDAPRPSKELIRIRGWLRRLVAAMELPANPLDQLIDLLGGADRVAELTGRKGSVSMDSENQASYKLRTGEGPQKELNIREKEAFMNGKKLVAIISDAASTGISLQADRRVPNQRRRCHITLELPWSADKAVQQFGRSHRANQVSAPLYRILVTPCGGEYRFAAAAAKRLQSLGALLKGDRNAIGAGTELKAFDIDNSHGEKALQRVIDDICGCSAAMPGVKIPKVPAHLVNEDALIYRGKDIYEQEVHLFYKYMRTKLVSVGLLDTVVTNDIKVVVPPKQKSKVPKFLNRLLGLCIDDQELLFDYYTDTLDATIAQLKSEGRYEQGIVTIRGQSCELVSKTAIYKDKGTGGEVEHARLDVDRGLSFEAACKFMEEVEEALEETNPGHRHQSGFYQQTGHSVMAGGRRRAFIVLATEVIKSASNIRNTKMLIQRPNMGSIGSMTTLDFESKGYTRIRDPRAAEELWSFWYNYTEDHCYHGDNCFLRRRGQECTKGMRRSQCHLLCGAVLPLWMRIEDLHKTSAYCRHTKEGKPMQLRIVKVVTGAGNSVVGVELPGGENEVKFLEKNLAAKPEGAAADHALGGLGAAYGAAAGHRYNRNNGGRSKARGRAPYR
ncbi:hypothetical protein N2152v2_006321 [Parachlorella kessleri]